MYRVGNDDTFLFTATLLYCVQRFHLSHCLIYIEMQNSVTYRYGISLMAPAGACFFYAQWVFYQIRKIAGCACAGDAWNGPHHRLQKKPLFSDPGMHHGTCVTHVPWCMSGLLTRSGGENVPGIPDACVTCNFTYLVRGPCFDCYLEVEIEGFKNVSHYMKHIAKNMF